MARRIFTTIFHKGTYVLNHSAYLHGHPDTLGLQLLLFLSKSGNITRFKPSPESTYILGYVPSPQATNPGPTPRITICPDTGGEILELFAKIASYPLSILHREFRELREENKDRWVYVIDLDTERFEMFEGRDEHAVVKSKGDREREKELGARFLKGWDLGALPNTRN